MDINWSIYLEAFFRARSTVAAVGRRDRNRLLDLTDFLKRNPNQSPGSAAFAWAETTPGNTTRKHRVNLSRSFLEFVSAFESKIDLPPKGFLPSNRRPAPFLFTNAEVLLLMEGTHQVKPAHSIRPILLKTLFGLLPSTGLRITEALHLLTQDARLRETPPHLHIRNAKFGKDRLVPLHPSVAEALEDYAGQRQDFMRHTPTHLFFPTELGKEFDRNSLLRVFQRICRRVGIQPRDGRYPTFHSFRHTFVVNRLTEWSRSGVDVSIWLPKLSVYLGHRSPCDTYWYLTATPELLGASSDSFERFAMEGGIK